MLLDFMQTVGAAPEWVVLFVCPALLVLSQLFLAHFQKIARPVALFLGGAEVFLLASYYPSGVTVAGYTGLFLLLYALTTAFRLIRFRKKGESPDEMYEKFHLDLSLPEEAEEERATFPAKDVRFQYAFDLIKKLETEKLAAGDRLELDAIRHALEAYRGKSSAQAESDVLNDSLASVLKLTAKYKL